VPSNTPSGLPDKIVMTRLSESAVLAGEILRKWSSLPGPAADGTGFGIGCPVPDTHEQERLEALEAVISELRRQEPNRDRAAACRYLVQHLSLLPRSVS
jgi:hypothetical protein